MRKILLTAFLVALAAGCAPTATLVPEADLARVLPGPGGTYRSSIPVPPVSLDELTHPDPRISEPAFRRLRTLYDDIPINVYTPPEYSWRFGVYWLAKKDWQQAARWFDHGLKAMAGEASFDREGRDIWDYGYQRALAYLQYEPAKALRDAKILVEKAAPARRGQETQKMKGLELLAMAQFALKDYEGVLATAEAYFKAVQEAGLATDSLWFNQYTARVRDLRAKALQALGRTETPQPQLQPQPQPQPQPRASDEPVRKNPTEAALEEAQKVAQGLVEALKAADLTRADTYLAVPRFDPSLAGKVGPEAKARAASFRFEVGRVVLPSAVQAYITVELTYDFGQGPRTVRLPMLSGEAGQGLKVLNGTPSVLIGAILGLGDLPDKVNAFLDEYLKALGL